VPLDGAPATKRQQLLYGTSVVQRRRTTDKFFTWLYRRSATGARVCPANVTLREVAHGRGDMPAVPSTAGGDVCRSRNVAALREFRQRGPTRRSGNVLSPARAALHGMPLSPASSVRSWRRHLLRLRIFLVVFGFVGGARQAIHRRDDRSARPRAGFTRG
jgi:hypothetical protein